MIVLLNLVSILIVVSGIWLAVKLKKVWPVGVVAVLSVLYMFVQPSYMPKGKVIRSDIPAFEQTDSDIEDRNLKAQSGEAYDKKRNDAIKEGLPFVK